MNGGLLPAMLVYAAFAIALANAPRAICVRALAALVATSTTVAVVHLPVAWTGAAHLACWTCVVACGASACAANGLGWRAAIGLALPSGAAAGAIVTLAGAPVAFGLVPLVAVVTLLAARAASRRVPIATKVVSSWLIAVALLAVTLQLLPVTPGYLPDHLE